MLQNIIQYFDHIPNSHRALILAGGITFFWLIEGVIPLFGFSYNKWKHASTNVFFTVTTIVVNFAFALLIVKASDWAVAHKFGLLYLLNMPLWVFLIADYYCSISLAHTPYILSNTK
jgi:hypothetical protein